MAGFPVHLHIKQISHEVGNLKEGERETEKEKNKEIDKEVATVFLQFGRKMKVWPQVGCLQVRLG